MSANVSYSLLKVRDSEPGTDASDDDFEARQKSRQMSTLMYVSVGMILITGAFIAGSLLQPLEWLPQHVMTNGIHDDDRDSPNTLVPECM
jgi:hypothetical protein